MKPKNTKQRRIGPKMRKLLILLQAGVTLSLTSRPDTYFRVLRIARKELEKINHLELHRSIKQLYQSQLIDYKENEDGTVSIILTKDGERRVLQYNLDNLKINPPLKWDRLWRVVIFDIPEYLANGRKALAEKLRGLGFYQMQKSVYIFPYECKNEIDFVVEIFNLRSFVRFLIVKETDIDLHLKSHFGLLD